MALTIRQKLAPFWHKLDDKDPLSAEFYLRPLTELQFLDIQNEASFRGKRLVLTADGIRKTLDYGLLDWRNVNDADGKPAKLGSEAVEELPTAVLRELAFKVIAVTSLSPDEKKTSSSPSMS